jgi:hypothetical protein
MARTASFFIRASVDPNGTTYEQTSIDLGAYVDALGKSVLRIHNISVQYGGAVSSFGVTAPAGIASTAFQLTTQSQGSMVNATDKSVIATGKIAGGNESSAAVLQFVSESLDIAPQHWTEGYLVGVEQIYLGTDSLNNAFCDTVSVVLECTVETLSSSAAMALALSQQ